MSDATVRQQIRTRIVDGRLPRDRIGRISAAFAAEEACDACSMPVSGPDVLYRLARAKSPVDLVFHSACFAAWKVERDYITSSGPGVLD